MKFLLVLTFGLFSITLFSQETAGIEYSPTIAFNWDMFKGKVNPEHLDAMGKNTGAVTVSSLSYKTEVRGTTAKVKISATFLPWESWTLYPKLSHPEEALNHEKRHFEICEIYARKIRQAVSRTHFLHGHFNEELYAIFKKLSEEERREQSRYDLETEHSTNNAEQKKWDARIDAQLKTLSDYHSPFVTVILK